MIDDIRETLLNEAQIHHRLEELAAELTNALAGEQLTVVAILNGSCIFLADLLRRIPLPLKVECIRVASYHGATTSSGTVSLHLSDLPDVRGRSVLLVDDILDTGRTLATVRDLLHKAEAARIRTCVLLDKAAPRKVPIEADYVAFSIPNEFVVGYGLDYMGHYRNLPFVGVLKPEAIARHSTPPHQNKPPKDA